MSAAKATVNHQQIRDWVVKRGGRPAHVRSTARGGDPGILRIDFPGFGRESSLGELSWDTFFHWFEENELAFLFQDEEESRFNKLVSRDSVDLSSDQATESGARKTPHALKLLEQQHREVEACFEQFRQSDTPQQKEAAFLRLADLLAAHSKIEETRFYPALLDADTEDALRESVEEHLMVKRLIADLMKMGPADPQYEAKMCVLEELVEHHVQEEEEELFSAASELDAEDLRALGMQMKEEFDNLIGKEPRHQVPKETGSAAALSGG